MRWLGFDWGEHLYHASDYFEQLYAWALHLIRAACEKVNDNSCVTKVYEKLVVFYPKTEYWANLLRSLKQGDTNDKQKINVLRLAAAVDVLKNGEDFTEMAQIALDEGLPAEAQSALEQAFAGGGVHLVVVPIDYSENTRVLVDELRERLPAPQTT